MENNLVNYLKQCDDAYYNSSNPLVSDATYDALVETLRRINPDHPYLKKVGAKVKSNKVGRLTPMGTLSKYHKEEEVQKWLDSEKGDILIAPKYDGFAVELFYHNGQLISASTRGDGNVGEDVLKSALRIQSIPVTLSKYPVDYLIVRGEAIIPRIHHDAIKALGYSAMRNAVPGIVRSNRVDALGYVDYVAYEFIDGSKDRVAQREYFSHDFNVEDYKLLDSSNIEEMNSIRDSLREREYKYELDGVVLKTREVKEDDLLNPSHMIAWKYKSNRETTILRDVKYEMGITGYFTPVAIFDEVEFQGAKLTRASLGNMTRLANEFAGMTIGSIIEVSRRGDIIPYVESLVMINEDGREVNDLTYCPHCGEILSMDGKEPHCVNKACGEKLRLQISQFAKSVGVKGIGDKLIRGLIDAGLIVSIVDIYNLNPEVIKNLPRQGQSAVGKWKVLQEKKLSPVELLSAYPFLDIGRKQWEPLLKKFSYREILYITEGEISGIKGFGESKIINMVSQLQENREDLIALGIIHNVL